MNAPVDIAIDALMHKAFGEPRTPRSAQYKEGARAFLVGRLMGRKMECTQAYAPGTPEADAFWAGIDEGRAIWRNLPSLSALELAS